MSQIKRETHFAFKEGLTNHQRAGMGGGSPQYERRLILLRRMTGVTSREENGNSNPSVNNNKRQYCNITASHTYWYIHYHSLIVLLSSLDQQNTVCLSPVSILFVWGAVSPLYSLDYLVFKDFNTRADWRQI